MLKIGLIWTERWYSAGHLIEFCPIKCNKWVLCLTPESREIWGKIFIANEMDFEAYLCYNLAAENEDAIS